MHHIYGKAAFVRGWLGPAEEDTDLALELMDKIQTLPKDSWEQIANPADIEHAIGSVARSQMHWAALLRLFQRKWFQRCWVVQEAILAREIEVMVGARRLPFSAIPISARAMNNFAAYQVPDHITIHSDWSALTTSYFADRALSLGNLLRWFRCFKASDPRDKLYGAFGWGKVYSKSNPSQGLVIAAEVLEVDYGCSLERTYTRVVHHIFTVDGDLSLLLCFPTKHRLQDLPSWVPDFSQPAKRRDNVGKTYYGNGATLHSKPYPSSNADQTLLDVGGTRVSDVIRTISLFPVNARMPREKRQYRDLLMANCTLHMIAHGTNYTGNHSPLDVAWTILRGFAEAGSRPPVALRREALVQYVERKLSRAAAHDLDDESQAIFDDCIDGMGHIVEKTGGECFDLERVEALKLNKVGRVPANQLCRQLEEEEKCLSGKFFATSSNLAGCAPARSLKQGDEVWLIEGLQIPLLLRPKENGRYENVGPCFVAGIMEGEVYEAGRARLITLA
jgi:hypothetical protein